MKWITREHAKVDRVACTWLITRFIDLDPQFEFLQKDTDWTSIRDGTVFDVPAEIVRAADSRPKNPHTAGEGLRWMAHGFSKLNLSDHEILDREFIMYDALYAECKEKSVSHESK
jgi:hypothetical protein